MIGYTAGSLGLVVLIAALIVTQLGFVLAFALLMAVFVPMLAGVLGLHALVSRRLRRVGRFG